MRKHLFLFVLLGGLPLACGCTKSVEQAEHDVRTARREATANVRTEQKEVEDAARAGREKIIEQERELEDARQAEVKRSDPTPR